MPGRGKPTAADITPGAFSHTIAATAARALLQAVPLPSAVAGVIAMPAATAGADWEDVTDQLREIAGFGVLSAREAACPPGGIASQHAVLITFDLPGLPTEYRAAKSMLCDPAPLKPTGPIRTYEVTLGSSSSTYYEATLRVTARSATEPSEVARGIDQRGKAPCETQGSFDQGTRVVMITRIKPEDIANDEHR